MKHSSWESVIGLEIHAQLATDSKIFSGAATDFGEQANSQACVIDLGFPGVLPVPNKAAILMAAKFGLAVQAEIREYSVFARKNYFYPDLPKGYQISQFELPIVSSGEIDIDTSDGVKTIRITRAHLEEDAGKSVHDKMHDMSGIDLNRAGTPLLEIVSEPDLRSAQEAIAYMREIHALVRYLQICDGNMQEGSFRCDANVSVRPVGQVALGTRTELKNINSFRFVEQAINYEIERQIDLLESGQLVRQETRLYDVQQHVTRAMRSKEEANDYRYFPDPDLPPIHIAQETIDNLRAALVELPRAKQQRFIAVYGLSVDDSHRLVTDPACADYYEAVIAVANIDPQLAANWICGELFATLAKENIAITDCPVTPQRLGEMLRRLSDGTLSSKTAKQVFFHLWQQDIAVDQIISEEGLAQVTDSSLLEQWVTAAIEQHPQQVQQYLNTAAEKRVKLLGFFIGQIMQDSKGKADPKQINKILAARLSTLADN